MKRNIGLFLILMILALTGCRKDLDVTSSADSSAVKIVARIPQFDVVNLDTKATKNGNESKITNMYMFIIDNVGKVTYKQFETSEKPLFTIDRAMLRRDYSQSTFTKAKIVIVANLDIDEETALRNASTLDDIKNVDFSVPSIDIPEEGFPMMGEYPVDLHDPDVANGETDSLKGAVLEIPLACLYAKVVFNISVRPLQTIAGVDQSFQLRSWKVFNVPTKVRLGQPDSDEQTEYAEGDGKAWFESVLSSVTNRPNNMIYESSQETDSLSFFFYMPEHKVNPKNTATYPWKDEDNDKYQDYRQYLKPTLVQDRTSQVHPCDTDQKAAYVEVNGIYKDHNNIEREVTYTIYLGDDNYSNFHVLRDHQYNNNIIIKGINNSTAVGDKNWVTYDHRVNVTQEDFTFGLQRETLLDCHWEIRPIRIDFNTSDSPDAVVEVILPNDVDWLSIESPSATIIENNATQYCEVDNKNIAYGKRRYYTTTLNTTLNDTKSIVIHRNDKTDHTVAVIDGHDAHTIWAYIDEYVNTEDGAPQYRYATVQCKYYSSEAAFTSGKPSVVEDYIFRQNNLFKIVNNDHTYYIEYYEEYLYNYDSKEQYGGTTDGMAWGMDGVQISQHNPAVVFGSPAWTQAEGPVEGKVNPFIEKIINGISDTYGAKYDFYLTRDLESVSNSGGLTRRDYSGLAFTQDIIDHVGFNIKSITTKDTPDAAVLYCLNRNKRDDDEGNIDLSKIKWYMPAIDEIEEICMGGYGEFEVFQDKYYWSSQPSYIRNDAAFYGTYLYLQGNGKHGKVQSFGNYYADDIERARATKINDSFQNVKSGSKYTMGTLRFDHEASIAKSGNFAIGDAKNYVEISDDDERIRPTVTSTSNYTPETLPADHYDPGNQPRTNINRVRVAYKP